MRHGDDCGIPWSPPEFFLRPILPPCPTRVHIELFSKSRTWGEDISFLSNRLNIDICANRPYYSWAEGVRLSSTHSGLHSKTNFMIDSLMAPMQLVVVVAPSQDTHDKQTGKRVTRRWGQHGHYSHDIIILL